MLEKCSKWWIFIRIFPTVVFKSAHRPCCRLPDKPLTGPLSVECTFTFKRPKAHFRTGKNAGVLKDSAPAAMVSTPDVDNVANAVVHMASLPLDANVLFMTVMATKMPFVGRG